MITHASCAHGARHTDDISLLGVMEAADIGRDVRRVRLREGAQLELPGRLGATIVLLAGRLSAQTVTSGGQETFVADVEPGDVIGEAFAFEHCDTPLEVTVDEAAEALCFDAFEFSAAVERHPSFAKAVIRAMCRRQCRTFQRMSELMTLPMANRLAAELRRLASCDATGRTIRRLPTHRQIAARIATQRETVTKELNRLHRLGAIKRERDGLKLIGPLWDARFGEPSIDGST